MSGTVIVIGGGVAGLSAAHELVERGFTVDVYEARDDFGGKARSQPVPHTGTLGRRDLPGEHGFRFYPRFYRHVVDTMERIPHPSGGAVADRLRGTTESAIAMVDNATWFRFHRRRVTRPFDVLETLELFFQELDFDASDIALFAAKFVQFFTTCDERRLGEYERTSWWRFLEGDLYSRKFQCQLAAVPRTMVAMDPRRGSARTLGAISMQLVLDFASAGVANDRTLGGPTSQVWFEPWLAYLRERGVRLHGGQRIASIAMSEGKIRGIVLPDGQLATADHFVLAVPLEVAARLFSPEMGAADPQLERIRTAQLDQLLSWMVGIQYFLYEDVPIVRGHTFYPDAPWGLTTISQAQFWREHGMFRRVYGAGDVGGVISVDISEWNTPGHFVKKPARMCTPREVAEEVWEQLKAALNTGVPGEEVLRDEVLHSWHLDDDLDYSRGVPPTNHGRLLVHPPGAWALRPEAASAIPNLTLASDYVRTHTDLASMEGANEAARRAVNAILDRTGSPAPRAEVWPLTEPESFLVWKRLDKVLYEQGRPHLFELLGIRKAAQAADLVRRLAELTGLDKLDDVLDSVRATEIIKKLLARFGAQ